MPEFIVRWRETTNWAKAIDATTMREAWELAQNVPALDQIGAHITGFSFSVDSVEEPDD